MTAYTFNVEPPKLGQRVEFDSEARGCLPATPNLERASLQNAVLFGGPAVRRCLEQAPIVGDHKHVFVDTKVALLLPGFIPAIPGWHTDGVPRLHATTEQVGSPFNAGPPSMDAQCAQEVQGYRPRFHTIHVGNHCPTRFMRKSWAVDLEHGEDSGLYRELSQKVESAPYPERGAYLDSPLEQWLSWNWWNLHTATPADWRGWRLLIRVTESDQAPLDSGFIRSQTQVYVPTEFGW